MEKEKETTKEQITGISYKRLIPFLTPSFKIKLTLGEIKVEDYFTFSKRGSEAFLDTVKNDIKHLLPKEKKKKEKWESKNFSKDY